MSVAELFPDHGIDLSEMTFGANFGPHRQPPARAQPGRQGQARAQADHAGGAGLLHASAAIILLTDGRRTTGMDTLEAAKLAADRGVRIHVVGLGNANGGTYGDESMAMYLQLDEPTLREVARMTGGDYHQAATAEKLRDVYATLGSQMQVVRRETELAALLALAAAVLMLAAGGLSVLWFRRIA
jgi:Ca-activated chloride channel family protein